VKEELDSYGEDKNLLTKEKTQISQIKDVSLLWSQYRIQAEEMTDAT
jgi:hypothetical protein